MYLTVMIQMVEHFNYTRNISSFNFDSLIGVLCVGFK